MKFILIGNYEPDNQESMERFALMLKNGLEDATIQTELWRPLLFLGGLIKPSYNGYRKWVGYIDKYLIFPIVILFKRFFFRSLRNDDIYFHICDHSNAVYWKFLPKNRTGITCHDVLAIRGALGFKDAYCNSTFLGIILQKWILKNLQKFQYIACVSNFTLLQLRVLCELSSVPNNWKVIHNAFNAEFTDRRNENTEGVLDGIGISKNDSYILHVGSDLKRKNRKLLLDMLIKLGQESQVRACFAGAPLEKELIDYAIANGINNRIISVIKPKHEILVSLYQNCEAFIFPSLSEGFGWPVIEAQACGCPVIASNFEPMPEISGGAAIHANPNDSDNFAKAFLFLKDTNIKSTLIKNGLENIKRFEKEQIIKQYLELYRA